MRGETQNQVAALQGMTFQSTPLTRGETASAGKPLHGLHNFNPLPSYEGRLCQKSARKGEKTHFNPLPSCEGRQSARPRGRSAPDFNPLPSYEGRLAFVQPKVTPSTLFQSAPLSRGETMNNWSGIWDKILFQSTPLMRGETDTKTCSQVTSRDFNPFPSCEGRRRSRCFPARRPQFQSAPLMRGETELGEIMCPGDPFQSTPLTRGETRLNGALCADGRISIHSPHTRGDIQEFKQRITHSNFNPLPSYEGRPRRRGRRAPQGAFQSTPLIRGETIAHSSGRSSRIFQSTPLTRGETKIISPIW